MSRRLPIYFLIDISESMVGEQIQLVEEGLATIIKELRSDPYALETVYISIVVFAGQPKTLVPLQEVINFYPPKFPIGSGTSLSKGLGHLMYELRKNLIKTSYEQKGDWKPIIFLFTDGVPTDDTTAAIKEWNQDWKRQANLVAVSFGIETDLHLLNELTDNVLLFKNTSAQSYKEFFRWVTASIRSSSVSIDANGSGFELANVNPEIISKIDLTKTPRDNRFVDTNFAVFIAKCQNTKRPYLIKYQRKQEQTNFAELNFETLSYRLAGAFPIDNSYFEFSSEDNLNSKINTEELEGFPACPSCSNQWGFSICVCGKVHCVGVEKTSTCPWCGNKGEYGVGGNSVSIDRTQG
jgi:uncharacterized protein YegL